MTTRTYDLPTATTRYYAHNFGSGVTLSGATNLGNTNSGYRALQAESHLNLAGISATYAGLDGSVATYSAQAVGIAGQVSVKNSTATTATSPEALGVNSFVQIGDQSATNFDLADFTVTNAVNYAGYTQVQAAIGRTTTVTNAMGFVHTGSRTSGGGTEVITNEYGFRMLDNSQATNKYGIVIDNASYTNTLGGITLKDGVISTTDSTAIQIDDGLNVSGTLNAKIIVTNEISSEDSTAIQINDALNVSGTLTANAGFNATSASNGDIKLILNGTGNVELGSQIETTTNFPSAMTSTSFAPDNARIRGAIRAYSNLAVAPYTSNDDQIIANADYSAIKTNGGTFSSTNTRTVGSDHTINFDLNGSDASAIATTGATSVRGSRNQVFYKNTAGGTKTGFMAQASANFLQIDAGHGGALTVSQIHGVQASATIAANTGETTTVTDYRGFSDTGISTSGTGTTGTNQILTNYYGFYTGLAPSSFGSGTVITSRPYAFYTNNSVWRSRIGYLDQHRIFGITATHSSSGAYTIDLGASGSGFHIITLGANITGFTFTNAPTITVGTSLVRLLFLQDGTGGRTISFTASGGETFLFKNGIKTLTDSTAAPEGLVVDIFTRYDGTNTRYYWNIDNGEYVL